MTDHSTKHEQPFTLPHWKLHDRLSRFPKFWDSGFLSAEILASGICLNLPEHASIVPVCCLNRTARPARTAQAPESSSAAVAYA